MFHPARRLLGNGTGNGKTLRFGKCYLLLAGFLVINCLILYQTMRAVHHLSSTGLIQLRQPLAVANKDVGFSDVLTMVIHDFEEYDNNVAAMAESVIDVNNKVKVLVITDKLPYPPIDLPENVVLLTLNTDILERNKQMAVQKHLAQSMHVILLPNGAFISSSQQIQDFYSILSNEILTSDIIVISTQDTSHPCHKIAIDYKKWTLKYTVTNNEDCVNIHEDDIIIMKRSDWLALAEPFARPLHVSISIQASAKQLKIQRSTKLKLVRHKPFKNKVNLWKHKSDDDGRLKALYKKLGIKLVEYIKPDGSKKTEWFGCTKETSRCFDTVFNDTPEYIYTGHWTPPCCLRALKETARHVFNTLAKSGVKYWLEGGSLLGAARYKDIIPWDYDIDIGIYKDDVVKVDLLKKAELQAIVDEDGFVWEKAREGQFYRVQYSEANHMHVDIFPFYPKDGIMTKDTWIKGHRQDTAFPEHYLKPLQQIQFAGMTVSAPNNIRKFLEYKFGKGVVENPQYPNPSKVKHTPRDML